MLKLYYACAEGVAVVEEGGGGTTRRLCDPFLDRYATMMDHDSIASILAEQEHMYVICICIECRNDHTHRPIL